MSSTNHFVPGSVAREPHVAAVETYQRSLSTHYDQLVARDSSSIHAGDRYTTNHISINSASSNVSVNGPAILIDSDILSSPGVEKMIHDLVVAALRKEEAQSTTKRIGTGRVQPCPNKVSKKRKRHSRDKNLPNATTRTSITLSLPPPGDHETVLTMKVRFTISYTEDSIFGLANHWYEYDIVVANPTYQRLVSSHSGIGIANFGVENEYFPSFEVCITLADGWVWCDKNSHFTDTRSEVFQCRVGKQTIETDMRFKRRPLLLYEPWK